MLSIFSHLPTRIHDKNRNLENLINNLNLPWVSTWKGNDKSIW
jgi:hypothetical protein